MRVYNLTGAQFAISNLALRRVKVSRFRDLNDPFELLGVNLGDKRLRKIFRDTKEDMDNKIGLLCFSQSWKNPLLWGHYAEKHTGIALGFDVPDDMLNSAIYAERLADFKLDKKTGRPAKGVVDTLMRTKFRDWAYEDEMRLFVELNEDRLESGLYFEHFSKHLRLREVILGPKCDLPIAGLRKLVADYVPKVSVIQARIAFTRFEVLENKVATKADK
jgi:Protein of unknown function (DUF2971)